MPETPGCVADPPGYSVDAAMARRTPAQFSALRSRREHAQANRLLTRMFREHGARSALVRLHEGLIESLYLEALDIWLAAHELPNRYRNAFGPGDPVGRRNLWPSIQLNLALAPGSSRPRARFVRDREDRIWVAHSGTLGGRQAGVSRTGFLELLGGAQRVTIDDTTEELVILGTFAEPASLLSQLARITHSASQYRDALAAGLSQ
ncbi:MAG: hypothetical protein JWP01_3566 [Myxococcales bacterium]|nr:hypothetical protein [Myxococcales bacterium]